MGGNVNITDVINDHMVLRLMKFDETKSISITNCKRIMNNKYKIFSYFDCFDELETFDDYIDYLFLEFVISYEDLNISKTSILESDLLELLKFCNAKYETIKIDTLIKFVQKNYKTIFSNDIEYASYAIQNYTLDHYLKYKTGFKNCLILDYLVESHVIFVLDNYDILEKNLMNNDLELLKKLLYSRKNIHMFSPMKFERVCSIAVRQYDIGNKKFSKELSKYIYSFLIDQLESSNLHLYLKYDLLKQADQTFYKIKVSYAMKTNELIREYDLKLNDHLKNHGKVRDIKFSPRKYKEKMDILDGLNLSSIHKFLFLTHSFNENMIFISSLEYNMLNYKSEFYDRISSVDPINDYFTPRRKITIEKN